MQKNFKEKKSADGEGKFNKNKIEIYIILFYLKCVFYHYKEKRSSNDIQ